MRQSLAVTTLFLLSAALAAAPCLSSVAVEEEETVFRLAETGAEKVFLVGDFNGWNPTIDLMVEVEGGVEVRLYLLPGSYRYRFVVDGQSRPDPDNPCLDREGNSCFTLSETAGGLEIVFGKAEGPRGEISRAEITPSGSVDAILSDGDFAAFARVTVAGVVDEKIDIDCSVGAAQEIPEGENLRGDAFLVRGLAAYRFENTTVRAFSRDARITWAGDPLELFGSVGPYRYPLGLFSRGGSFEGKLPLGLEAWMLYASRLDGYVPVLEGMETEERPFPPRDLVDSDAIGAALGAKIDALRVRYLFRQDRRPVEGYWSLASFGDGLFRGFERFRAQGLSLSFAGPVAIEGEFLYGKSFLEASERSMDGGESFTEISREELWQDSYRLYAGVSHTGERIRSKLSFRETSFGDAAAASVECPDGSRRQVDGSVSFETDELSLSLSAAYENYHETHGEASHYRLAGVNFWLDGDELSYELIPFFGSRDIYEFVFAFGWRLESPGELPWGKGLRLTAAHRAAPKSPDPLFRKIELAYGFAIHPRVDFLLDMRGVTYRYEATKRDFVDAFLSVRGRLTSSLWCALGAGIDPYAFDREIYAFASHGREEYLAGRGIFTELAADGLRAAMETLIEAEEALSDDWVITVEAGFTF